MSTITLQELTQDAGTLLDPVEELRLQAATRKARLLRRLLQGTMGLESQALSDEFLDKLEGDTIARLMTESRHEL
jgi:hypothetical protein